MSKIIVDPTSIIKSATVIERQNEIYTNQINSLSDLIDNLSSIWQGKDNLAFTSKIKTYIPNIKSISLILNQYSDFLRNAANAYQNTQNELISEVHKLSEHGWN